MIAVFIELRQCFEGTFDNGENATFAHLPEVNVSGYFGIWGNISLNF